MRLWVDRCRDVVFQCVGAGILLYPLWHWTNIPVPISGFVVGATIMYGNLLRWRHE